MSKYSGYRSSMISYLKTVYPDNAARETLFINSYQDASQAQVDAATDALKAAIDALEVAVLDFGAGQPAALTLKRGQVYQIKITSNNKSEILFFSANGNVSLSPAGLVTGVKPGIAIITVVDTWSGQFFNIVINVTN